MLILISWLLQKPADLDLHCLQELIYKAIDCTEMMLLWCLIEKFVLKFDFEKRGIFNKITFLHKAFNGDFWKGIPLFLLISIVLDR